jgi:S-DNA-T family DNA segregation ATPase FtsK/SpoIIIE
LIKNNSEASYSEEIKETIANVKAVEAATAAANERDEYFIEAGRFIIEKDKASIGMLQRVYRIGFNRAARIMDQLAEVGVVGPEEGTKPRKILMSAEEYEQFIAENELSS